MKKNFFVFPSFVAGVFVVVGVGFGIMSHNAIPFKVVMIWTGIAAVVGFIFGCILNKTSDESHLLDPSDIKKSLWDALGD